MELSRLEAMITTTSVARPSDTETEESRAQPSSGPADGRFSAVAEAGNMDPHPSRPGSLRELGQEGPTVKNSGIEFTSQRTPSDKDRKGFTNEITLQRARQKAVTTRNESNFHIASTDIRSSMDKPEDESPTGEVNKVSDLYAKFSKDLELHQSKSTAIEFDGAVIHRILRQSLARVYPPEVVRYISLRQVTTLCEDHMDFLDRRPNVQLPVVGKMKDRSYVDSGSRATTHSSMLELRGQVAELRKSIKASRDQCIRAGYALSELDTLLCPPGLDNHSFKTPTDRASRKPEINSGDESSSIYSEDFYSPAE